MTIGNFKHQPNLDALKYLHSHIWPIIRKELPQAELNIYGAYAPEAVEQLHNPATGFLIKGWIADKKEAFIQSRICLAPLRFGAGQKGKLLDSMVYGTPSVTTTIGAEGMLNTSNWNGFIENEKEAFALKAVQLYQDQVLWNKAQKNGYALLQKNYDKKAYESTLVKRLESLGKDLDQHRKSNFTGAMLSHHLHQSTKFLSKWIETKNLLNDKIVE